MFLITFIISMMLFLSFSPTYSC